jgi:phosphatidylglycerophosphatase A
MNSEKKWVVFFASGCGAGFSPFAPGTAGTLAALPVCLFIGNVPLFAGGIMVLGLIIFAIKISDETEKLTGRIDPECIVIDEMAGMVLTLYAIPLNLMTVLFGFVLFRILDILKPYPINWIEKKFDGGMGIVLDDVAAGVFGNLILRMVLLIA